MFKRNQIVEVLTPGGENNYSAKILRQCREDGMGDWWEAKEIPADDERARVLRRCERMGYGGFLAHQSQLRLLSNR